MPRSLCTIALLIKGSALPHFHSCAWHAYIAYRPVEQRVIAMVIATTGLEHPGAMCALCLVDKYVSIASAARSVFRICMQVC